MFSSFFFFYFLGYAAGRAKRPSDEAVLLYHVGTVFPFVERWTTLLLFAVYTPV